MIEVRQYRLIGPRHLYIHRIRRLIKYNLHNEPNAIH